MSENQQEQKKVVLEWGYDGEIGYYLGLKN